MIRVLLLMAILGTGLSAFAAEPRVNEKSKDEVQTLDSITIEGDVAVPQVLFITSREHPRHREDLGRRLRPGPLSLVRGISGPDRLVIIDDCVSETIKEQ